MSIEEATKVIVKIISSGRVLHSIRGGQAVFILTDTDRNMAEDIIVNLRDKGWKTPSEVAEIEKKAREDLLREGLDTAQTRHKGIGGEYYRLITIAISEEEYQALKQGRLE